MSRKGNMRINGKDAYETWGAYLLDGSVSALMASAGTKTYIENESRLQNGKRVIRTDKAGNSLARVAARDVMLQIGINATGYADLQTKLQGLLDELMKDTSAVMVAELGNAIFHLDYISVSNFSQLRGRLAKYAIKFNEPNPANRI